MQSSNKESISSWNTSKSIIEAARDSDSIVVLTDWEQFKYVDWEDISSVMRSPSWLIDTRNIINHEYAISSGLKVWRIGIDN